MSRCSLNTPRLIRHRHNGHRRFAKGSDIVSCSLFVASAVGFRGEADIAPRPEMVEMTHLYGPAARCKPKMMIWRTLVLRFCIRPVDGAIELLAIMDIRARSISFASRPRRPYGSPDHERAGETFSPSPLSDSQTSAGSQHFLPGLA